MQAGFSGIIGLWVLFGLLCISGATKARCCQINTE